jgi:hypothetical protein
MRRYPVFRVPTEALGPTSGEAANPHGANFSAPRLVILNFLLGSQRQAPGDVPELKVQKRPPLMLRNIEATTEVEDVDGGPPGGCWRQVRQRPPPKLKTSMAGPLGGASSMSGSGYHRS